MRLAVLGLLLLGLGLGAGLLAADRPGAAGGGPSGGGAQDGGAQGRGARDGGTTATAPRRPDRRPRPVRCPDDVPGCRAVQGRVVLVESVDPDGDGDLHVVVVGGGITGPGVTAIDVPPALRPERDPRVGDRVSAAGPVQPGTYGQSQIHALRFRAQRR